MAPEKSSTLSSKMPEAEVSLRLAFFLIKRGLAASDVHVAIDGAQIKTTSTVHFAIAEFLKDCEWQRAENDESWQGSYGHADCGQKVIIHSNAGRGDVVAELTSGWTLRVECKKGPLVRSTSSAEYRLFREALGQLLTIESVGNRDLLAVAVPRSAKLEELARRWRNAPLIRQYGICLLTVDRHNHVDGLPASGVPRAKNWERTFGMFKDDPGFEEMCRLGREWRKNS